MLPFLPLHRVLESEVEALRAELDAARRRAETAEEWLCAQLGEPEVEVVELARAYQELAVARASS
jgi:hypothetical protein